MNFFDLYLVRIISVLYYVHHLRRMLYRVENHLNEALTRSDYRRASELRSIYDSLFATYSKLLRKET